MRLLPFAMRFSTMSMSMYVPALPVPSLGGRTEMKHFYLHYVFAQRKYETCAHVFVYLLPAVDNDWAGATSVAFIHLSDQQRWETARETGRER